MVPQKVLLRPYVCFVSEFSITHNKGKKCSSLYLFESKVYSIAKKLLGLGWEKAAYRLFFLLAKYPAWSYRYYFTFIEFNFAHFKWEKKL